MTADDTTEPEYPTASTVFFLPEKLQRLADVRDRLLARDMTDLDRSLVNLVIAEMVVLQGIGPMVTWYGVQLIPMDPAKPHAGELTFGLLHDHNGFHHGFGSAFEHFILFVETYLSTEATS